MCSLSFDRTIFVGILLVPYGLYFVFSTEITRSEFEKFVTKKIISPKSIRRYTTLNISFKISLLVTVPVPVPYSDTEWL